MAKKPVITAKEAAAMIPDGATIMCGGFLACGQARAIVKELVARGTKDLTLIANDMGRATGPMGEEFFGIAELIHNHQVKRVIATAGQTVDIDFNLGQVYVDGELLDEDYINDYTYREEGTVFPLTVPEGEVFLMGDNRNHSNDSRDSSLGTVDTRLLIGKAVFLVFPGRDYLTEQREFGRIGLLQ